MRSISKENSLLTSPYPVCIFFEDESISDIFSALLEVYGCATKTVTCPSQLGEEPFVITEPQFFSWVNPKHHPSCLIVGNKQSPEAANSLFLSRPLTEDKVEQALSRFIAQMPKLV